MELTTNREFLFGISDPVEQWSFDVLFSGKAVAEVTRVKATEKTLAITFLVTENLELQDFSSSGATVRLYQKLGDDPKYIVLKYNLTSLKATTFDLDGDGIRFGIPSLLYVTQVYRYEGMNVYNSK